MSCHRSLDTHATLKLSFVSAGHGELPEIHSLFRPYMAHLLELSPFLLSCVASFMTDGRFSRPNRMRLLKLLFLVHVELGFCLPFATHTCSASFREVAFRPRASMEEPSKKRPLPQLIRNCSCSFISLHRAMCVLLVGIAIANVVAPLCCSSICLPGACATRLVYDGDRWQWWKESLKEKHRNMPWKEATIHVQWRDFAP